MAKVRLDFGHFIFISQWLRSANLRCLKPLGWSFIKKTVFTLPLNSIHLHESLRPFTSSIFPFRFKAESKVHLWIIASRVVCICYSLSKVTVARVQGNMLYHQPQNQSKFAFANRDITYSAAPLRSLIFAIDWSAMYNYHYHWFRRKERKHWKSSNLALWTCSKANSNSGVRSSLGLDIEEHLEKSSGAIKIKLSSISHHKDALDFSNGPFGRSHGQLMVALSSMAVDFPWLYAFTD